MKKTISIISAVALFATIATSCKKKYTCECCTSSSGSSPVCASATSSEKMKKKEAKEKCEKSVTSSGVTTECKLK